jgi:copper(I)-binding protein
MRRAALAALVLMGCASDAPRTLFVHDAFLVPGAGLAPGVLYATVTNPTARPDTLVAIESAAAASLMLHATRSDGAGRETMAMVPALEIPAHGSASLIPGAVHAMVDGLRPGIVPGDTATVTFRFTHGGLVQTVAKVIDYGDVDRLTAAHRAPK